VAVLVFELNNLDVGWFLGVLINLNQLSVVLLRPLILTVGLAVHIPVTMWTETAVSALNVAVLVLHNLVLVLGDWVLRVEDWVVNWQRFPVAVVGTPCGLVGFHTGWWRIRVWRWSRPVRIIGLAGGNDSVTEVVLEWNVRGAESGTVWQFNPSGVSLQ
jgi:hypothetical protein